jgi:hypothetical protein
VTRDPAALITTAKALAPNIVAWVAEDEPLGYLIGNRTWAEVVAVTAVLAEAVGHCADGPAVLAEVCAATDSAPPVNRGPGAKWSRPDDGIVDDEAVKRVAAGESTVACPVPLSPPERLRAAALITEAGGGASIIAQRLHVNGMNAWDLLRRLREGAEDEEGAA